MSNWGVVACSLVLMCISGGLMVYGYFMQHEQVSIEEVIDCLQVCGCDDSVHLNGDGTVCFCNGVKTNPAEKRRK